MRENFDLKTEDLHIFLDQWHITLLSFTHVKIQSNRIEVYLEYSWNYLQQTKKLLQHT